MRRPTEPVNVAVPQPTPTSPSTPESQPTAPRTRPRDLAIDRLRAACLISMAVGHLALALEQPLVVDRLIHLPTWVSGAAGFVFLSGVSTGLYWTSRGSGDHAHLRTIRRWSAARGVFLAVLAAAVSFAGVAWFRIVTPPPWYPEAPATPGAVITARWSLPFIDVLWMYAAFLVVAAFVAPMVLNRPRLALGIGGALYLASHVVPLDVGPTKVPGTEAVWNLPAWWLLFLAGLVAGVRWDTVRAFTSDHATSVWRLGALGVAAIVALRVVFNLVELGFDPLGLDGRRADIEVDWLDKSTLAPLRLLLIVAVGPAAYLLADRIRVFDGLFVSAGARSLRVYLASTVLAFALVGLPLDELPVPLLEVGIMILVGATLLTGRARAFGRGRPWSI